MGMLQEFKTFIARGNVLDLAVGVIIGAAFGKIVTSLTENVIMPAVGYFTGGADFSKYFIRLGPIPETYKGKPDDYAALKEAGVAMIGYGDFVTQIVNFVILAFVIFLIVKSREQGVRQARGTGRSGRARGAERSGTARRNPRCAEKPGLTGLSPRAGIRARQGALRRPFSFGGRSLYGEVPACRLW